MTREQKADYQTVVQALVDEVSSPTLNNREAFSIMFDRVMNEVEACRGDPQKLAQYLIVMRERKDEIIDSVLDE